MVKLTSNWNFKFFIHPIEICKDIYTLPRKNDYSFCTYLPMCGFNSFSLSSDISARKTLLFEKYFCNFTLHSLKVLKHNFKSRQIGHTMNYIAQIYKPITVIYPGMLPITSCDNIINQSVCLFTNSLYDMIQYPFMIDMFVSSALFIFPYVF